jgi:hypothetical protein
MTNPAPAHDRVTTNRVITNLVCEDITTVENLFRQVFGFVVHYTSDWFIILKPHAGSELELGLIRRDHDIVPANLTPAFGGVYLTLVVDDLEEVERRCRAQSVAILEGPTPLFYGQTRLLIAFPGGIVIDVSSPTKKATAP